MATTKSAMVVSSVSPERCDTIAVHDARWASWMAWIVSVSVPIWFSLIKMLLQLRSRIARRKNVTLVTSRSSPTNCTRSPSRSVSRRQPFQSSSASPSSMLTMGYLLTQSSQKSTI